MKNKMMEPLHYAITLLLTFLAMGLIVYHTFGSFYSIAKEDAVALGEISVKERAEKLSNFLLKGKEVMYSTRQNVEYMLENGYSKEDILHFMEYASENYARHMGESFTGIYGVVDNTYLDGVGWVPEDGYIPQERLWYQDAIRGEGEPVIGSLYVDALTHEVIVSISQMLSNGTDVLSLDIIMTEMQVLAEDIQLNGNGYGFIMDESGFIAAHQDEQQRGKNYLTDPTYSGTDLQKLIDQILSSQEDTFTAVVDGEECVVFKQVVENDWYAVMVINSSELFARVEKNLIRNIIVSSLIFALVAYFCTASYQNRAKAQRYAAELKEYQFMLEERVLEQTQEIKQQSAEMLQLQEDVIERMATLIESRDTNTGEHVKNTKRYVEMIARYMYDHELHPEEVTQQFVENITRAAALHDVGKIKISDLILNKPTRLTAEEYEIMKTHSVIGGKMVQDILGENADKELLKI
ncbi:MAG: HD domain-containing protein, partial [Oscillospiraceae bacterium]|nr:HD domain-containing protein [Oscillospiraceae bacterium]